MTPRSIVDRIWDEHVVAPQDDGEDLLHIDRVMLHERSGAGVLRVLHESGRPLWNAKVAFGAMDHVVDTRPGRTDATIMPTGTRFIHEFRERAHAAGMRLFDLGDPDQGITHVVSPEQAIVLPGVTMVCTDSHTCTLGGLGALAWGIGASDAEHALATQTLVVRRPQVMRVEFTGSLPAGIVAKDMILALIGRIGAGGGADKVLEFTGAAVRGLPVSARLTLCNMAVECAARTGIVAPDDIVFEYLHGRPYAPKGAAWDAAVTAWRGLASDPGARYVRQVVIDAASLAPQVTWGTSPEHVGAVDGRVPDIDPAAPDRAAREWAMAYMGVQPGQAFAELPIQAAFIGACTNARIEDLRAAASVLRGRQVAAGVHALCVPGSSAVKRQAEAEGLDTVFRDAGFQWRESGCSLCFFSGGESFPDGARVVSSTNRNFENRQGPGIRSHLASPATVAASAVAGRIADIRRLG